MTIDNSGLISASLIQTAPQLAASIDADNSWKAAIRKRGARVRLFRDYERGDHRASITKEMKKMLRISADDIADLNDFNDNYCKVVVDKMAARVFVSSISAGDDAADWLKDTLERNDFDAQQQTWYRGSIRDGDSYVMIDSETLLWVSEPAYDGFSGMTVIIDSMTRKPIWACKLWSEADTNDIAGDDPTHATMRIIVYQPDQVSYWKGETGGASIEPDMRISVVSDSGNGAGDVSELVNFIEWPLGRIPLIHYANQTDNFTQYGESELRPAIPLQDVLNRTLHSMVMASEFSAFKLLWSIGFEIDVDGIIPGGVVNLVLKDGGGTISDPTEGQLEFLKSVKVGQFEATDISQYTNQIDKIVQQISQVTQTPILGITTKGVLSGEAMKQFEIGLLEKVGRYQQENTDAIKEMIELTAEMQNTFDGFDTAPKVEDIIVIWKPAEILDVNARVAALSGVREKNSGLFTDEFYIKRIGALLGMSQIDIKDEIEKAKSQQGLLFEALSGGGGFVPPV